MHRFFLKPEDISGQRVTFPEELAHQIIHVLRLDEGDQVVVLDNQGSVHEVELVVDRAAKILEGRVTATRPINTEPDCHLALFFGLTSREKVEWILQKGTEVGVSAFFPYLSSRTIVQSASVPTKKLFRWERIIREAAEQSGRGRLPELHQTQALVDSLSKVSGSYPLTLLAWEGAQDVGEPLQEVLKAFKGESIALFVGPEGGFSEDEVRLAINTGCKLVSLGSRILRMETAAMILPALVLYELSVR